MSVPTSMGMIPQRGRAASAPSSVDPGGPLGSGHPQKCFHNQILVVDDEESIGQFLTTLLTDQGYAVHVELAGDRALAYLHQHDVALVLADLMLPDMDGITMLEQMFQLDPKICGIVMTGHGTIDLAVRAVRVGAVEFVSKPFHPDVVVVAVKRHLELCNLRRENSVLKQTVLKQGGVRVHAFHLNDFDPTRPRSAGHDDAEYLRGLSEGEQRSQAKIAADRAREHGLVTNAVRELDRTVKDLLPKMEDHATALAFEIASKIIPETTEEKRDYIASQAKRALDHVWQQGHRDGLVTIYVHPGDIPYLEGVRTELARDSDGGITLKVEGDSAITPGGCRVETATRIVDATLEAQLVRVGEALKRKRPA